MIYFLKMAFRDLGRNRRRSFFSSLALGMGLALLLLMAAVLEGEMRGSMDLSIKLQSGDLQVRSQTYDENKNSLAWQDLVENPEAVAAQIATLAPVKAATPRLFASGIVASGDQTLGVRILGIDPPSAANDPFREGMVSGEFLTADDRQGILVGQPLAENLGLKAGDSLNLLVNTSNGDVDEQAFVIRGIYSTHTPSYDQTTIFMPLAKAQAITQTENHASTIFVLLNNRDQAGAVASALQTGQYQVQTWQQMNELILQTEQFAGAYMYMLYLIVLGITATVIINTLIMAVFERTREIGILAAIGMKGRRIMAMFFAESALLAVGGIFMGLVLGGLMVLYATRVGFYIGDLGITGVLFGDRIYGYLTPQAAINLTILAFIVTLLAALYPALLAARMEPVEALHSGN
jgi:ABC-type lipoprotein release transport system permease subunit